MKKLLALTALVSLTATSAFAATTGTLLLQGVVGQKVSITVTEEATAATLDLETTQVDLKVATVNEISNSKTGYSVTITSANLGNLKRTDGAEVFPYSLKYAGASVALSTGAGSTFSTATGAAVNINKDVEISYTGVAAELMVEGTYADTVTFNISAN